MMEVIPVIDLKGGAVVRARFGHRESYQPIETPLARTSAPADIVAGLLAFYPFRTIYVADLDAIESQGSHDPVFMALTEEFPAVTFWADAGLSDAEAAQNWLTRHPGAHLVIGSESLRSLAPLKSLAANDRVLLSLDFRGETLLGPEGLLDTGAFWPQRIIVMSLARVGSHAGPDMDRLGTIACHTPAAKLYAAGGLRCALDLEHLATAGVTGVLVASALHERRLTRADLEMAEGRTCGPK